MTTNTTLFELENAPTNAPLLQVNDLHVEFTTREGVARAVNGVNFTVELGKTLAVLGESGSGKSVTAQATGHVDDPPGKVTGGEVLHRVDILKFRRGATAHPWRADRHDLPGCAVSLNPRSRSLADQRAVPRAARAGKEAQANALELMERVSIPAAKERFHNYPHQFSGGMKQRVMIAMALALEPEVLIADEPTTALDVTVQAQILDLLQDLQKERNMGLILITHDLGVVAEVADRIAGMYAGRIVEHASVRDMFARPAHPYSLGLIDSIPRLDDTQHELRAIGGLPPSLTRLPTGCAFHPRCRFAADLCLESTPDEVKVSADQASRCFFAQEVFDGRR
jgi:oligopeptide transport system ATP-binding protein